MSRKVTIYHNPHCSKSRQGLALLQEHGIQPQIVYYLETPPDAASLRHLLKLLKVNSVRDILRQQDDLYHSLHLADETLTEQALIDALLAHPQLLERPVVLVSDAQNGDKACIARPTERILEIIR